MLNDEARKALVHYNTASEAKYKGARAANTHEIATEDDNDPNQDLTDESPCLPDLTYIMSHQKISCLRMTLHLNISSTPTLKSSLSTRHIFAIYSNIPLHHMVLWLIGELLVV